MCGAGDICCCLVIIFRCSIRFHPCFLFVGAIRDAKREIGAKVVRYQPDESQVPHIDTSYLPGQRQVR